MKIRFYGRLLIIFSSWILFSNLFLFLFGKYLPVAVTNFLSIAYYIFIPIVPLLKPIGLTEGGHFEGPTMFGVLLGTILYSLVFFAIGKVVHILSERLSR